MIRKYDEGKEYAKSLISKETTNSFFVINKTNNKMIIT